VLREVAEYPNSFSPIGENEERIETDRYTLCIGAGSTWNTVQRQRFALEQLDDVLAEVRAALRERGRTQTQWEVGSSAPEGLVDALLERGLEPEKDPYAVALVLTVEPPPIAPGFAARQIESLEEMEAAMAVQWEAFEATPEEIEEARSLLPDRFRQRLYLRHAVWLDGGATKPNARGRGAYRALIRVRWDDAVALGTPALITQGGSMSRPILERLGFERVGEVHMLLDRFDP
jgi:hypothetical protein